MRLSDTHEKYGASVKIVHLVLGVACIVLIGASMLWGAWCWHRHQQSQLFWRLLRTGQAAVVVEVALGGVLVAIGKKESSLHLIYGLLPLAVSFLGEQLRISSPRRSSISAASSRRPRSASCPRRSSVRSWRRLSSASSA